MKKAYSKPEIAFEDFAITTNIAGDCEYKTNTPSVHNCGLNFGNMVIFLDTMTNVCTGDGAIKSEGGDGLYNGFCYHVFDNGKNNIFNS